MTKFKHFIAAYTVFVIFAYAASAVETMASGNTEISPPSHLEKRAQTAIMAFQKALKGELMAAMQKGGPKAAVEICNEKAPQIAAKIGLEKEVTISRTSLKVRNANNTPTAWQKQTLEEFETRKSEGQSLRDMSAFQYEEDVFTYMKPIPMMGMCATCHGTTVPAPLYAHIKQFYPDDQAIGFKPGDIRGAFVVQINEGTANN